MLISLLLFSKITFSQIKESFTDRDFLRNPVWIGDTASFYINSQDQLQSNGANKTAQILALSTENPSVLNTNWEFFVQLNFDPTTSNYVRIYLSADQEDLKSSLNGYFVQIGETGAADGFHLYRQNGTRTTRIITGVAKSRSNAAMLQAKIRVTCDALGNWELLTDVTGGNNFISEGTVTDTSFTVSNFMGVYCRYATASRYNQFIFDDFFVDDLVADTLPPVLQKVIALDSNLLELTFSEPLEQVSALLLDNYRLTDSGNLPKRIESTASASVMRLQLGEALKTGNYTLTVQNISDRKGNVLRQGIANFFYIRPYVMQPQDVVVNEIFANPTGSLGIPQKEFVELWNISNEYLLLQGYQYSDKLSTYTFAADTLAPHQYLILCARADTALFKPFGKTIGLSPWPSLNNTGDILTIRSPQGNVIDEVAYTDTWYDDEEKKKGGFSLELIDPKNQCKGSQNWIASSAALGASPGMQNAVFQQQLNSDALKLVSAKLVDSITIEVIFSKMVDSLSASVTQHYQVNNGVGAAVEVRLSNRFKTAQIRFNTPLPHGLTNTLTLTNLTDCGGKGIEGENTAEFFIAKKPKSKDLLISEVLFNPKSEGVDFVEVYNNADYVLDFNDFQLANVDSLGKPANRRAMVTASQFIPPKTYWVLTTDASNIKELYYVENPNNFVEMSSLPAYNNSGGTVVLLSKDRVIDQLNYSPAFHHPLIQDADGISIERVSFDAETISPDNFKSAAASVGFATPTYRNSNALEGNEEFVQLISKTFSPDGDGFEDALSIVYQMKENERLATVNVFSDKGILTKRILKNETIATKGTFYWDGSTEDGSTARMGIYIVVFDVFDVRGTVKRFKNTCVLAGKLN
ncbi:lamin tail domain-containing protein [Pedobacter sp. MW01-1-1]|uniref:lamin tail domain-containing protein n=1 Tax=Pedobacter sp. MW01-1-1 TaxID=3383027 RepID=UPI003FEDC019